jgi:hypothetical protein
MWSAEILPPDRVPKKSSDKVNFEFAHLKKYERLEGTTGKGHPESRAD